MKIMRIRVLGAHSLALATALAAAAPASSQSQLDAADATEFLGRWDIELSTEYGAFAIDLVIADVEGKVGVRVGGPELGGMHDVDDVSRSGESLVLSTEVDAQGQIVPITMTLKRDGEELAFSIDAAGGAYYITGRATRAAGDAPSASGSSESRMSTSTRSSRFHLVEPRQLRIRVTVGG